MLIIFILKEFIMWFDNCLLVSISKLLLLEIWGQYYIHDKFRGRRVLLLYNLKCENFCICNAMFHTSNFYFVIWIFCVKSFTIFFKKEFFSLKTFCTYAWYSGTIIRYVSTWHEKNGYRIFHTLTHKIWTCWYHSKPSWLARFSGFSDHFISVQVLSFQVSILKHSKNIPKIIHYCMQIWTCHFELSRKRIVYMIVW